MSGTHSSSMALEMRGVPLQRPGLWGFIPSVRIHTQAAGPRRTLHARSTAINLPLNPIHPVCPALAAGTCWRMCPSARSSW